MAKMLGDITTIIKDYVNDTTITADQHAIDAVNFLSNIFPVRKIDSSKTTTVGQNYLTKPTGCLKISRVYVNGAEVPEANFNALGAIEEAEEQRWYFYDDKIMFTENFDTTGQAVKIWYEGSFIVPAAAVATDVPDEMMELVYVGGAFRYYRKMVSVVATQREKYPDVKPVEISKIRDQWQKEFNDLLTEYKKK